MTHFTAYNNSRRTDAQAFGREGPFIHVYDVRNSVVREPPTVITERADPKPQGSPPAAFEDVVFRIVDGRTVMFPDRPLMPAPLCSGQRTLRLIQRQKKNGNYYVHFTCACGRYGHVMLGTWRTAAPDAGCNVCRKALRRAGMQLRRPEGWVKPTESGGA